MQHQIEAAEVRLDRALHVGILQLAGKRPAIEPDRAVHLTERGGRRGGALEAREPLPPAGAELRPHAPVDEGTTHRRRLRLERQQLGHVFGRQRPRHGRQQLRELDDRAVQVAERVAQLAGELGLVLLDPEIALGGQPRDEPAEHGRHPDLAREPARQAAAVAHARRKPRAETARTFPRHRRLRARRRPVIVTATIGQPSKLLRGVLHLQASKPILKSDEVVVRGAPFGSPNVS